MNVVPKFPFRFAILATVFVAFCVPAFAANAPAPKPPDPLDTLFASLAKTHSEEDAKPIEQAIEQAFLVSDSPTVGLLMTRAAAALQAGDGATAKKLLDYVTDIAPD